jgi:SWI/SNF-related matrix-associated actin-dependent regulator of chromatin subfamily A-like protein 1
MTMNPLRNYQRIGADWLAATARAFLGDDTGLGKSAQALAAAHKVGAKRLLIICPAIGRVSWQIELPKWSPELPVVVIGGGVPSVPAGPCAVILGYDALSRKDTRDKVLKALAKAEPFDVLILDEAHYLKELSANRTKAIYVAKHSLVAANDNRHPDARVWALSATPQKNHAGDLFPHIQVLFPQVLASLGVRNYPEFIERFCLYFDGPYGRTITGNNRFTIPKLREALRPYLLVRRKRDVAPELGEIQRITLPFAVDTAGRETARTGSALDTFFDGLADNDNGEIVLPPSVGEQWAELGRSKIAPAVAWARDFLDADDKRKLVIFAHHRDVIEGLAEAFGPLAVKLYGGTTPKAREDAVRRFQEDDSVRIFIGQTIAAGTSITLTAAADVLMLEPSWSPMDDYQAISRCHRLGQLIPVTVYYAFAAGTVDDRIARRAKKKSEDFEQLTGELAVTTTSVTRKAA